MHSLRSTPSPGATPKSSPPAHLLERLSRSSPTKVTRKEMLEINKRNYGKLPEVKKMREQQEKRDILRERKEKIKAMDQVARIRC
jgi:hypothetical protein